MSPPASRPPPATAVHQTEWIVVGATHDLVACCAVGVAEGGVVGLAVQLDRFGVALDRFVEVAALRGVAHSPVQKGVASIEKSATFGSGLVARNPQRKMHNKYMCWV